MDWFKFQTAVKSDRGTTSQLLERGRPKSYSCNHTLQTNASGGCVRKVWANDNQLIPPMMNIQLLNTELRELITRWKFAKRPLHLLQDGKRRVKKNPSIIALNVNFTSVLTLIEVEMGTCVHVIGFTSVLTLKKIISKCGIRFHSEYKKTTLN